MEDLVDKLEKQVRKGKKSMDDSEIESEESPIEEPLSKDPAFNCPACMGEGMTFPPAWPEGKICDQCGGTGKI